MVSLKFGSEPDLSKSEISGKEVAGGAEESCHGSVDNKVVVVGYGFITNDGSSNWNTN